jgi:hypothetical protein
MAGLMQPQGQPEEESNVSPEDQRAYDTFVTNGMKLMYSEKAMPTLVQAIQGGGNPVEGLANAALTVVTQLEQSAKQKGKEISPDVKYHGSEELLAQMAELAEAAGVHEFSEEELEQAFFLALDMYRVAKQEAGELDEGALKQDMQMLQQADQQGQLDQVVPGASQYAQQRGGRNG